MIPLTQPLLGDSDGEWCAICLDHEKKNHSLTNVSSAIRGSYGFPFSTVRAHERCMAAIPVFQLVPQIIATYVRSANRMSIQQIDKAAKEFHDKGLYSLSAALKDILLRKSERGQHGVSELEVVERRIASLAGVRDQRRHSLPMSRLVFKGQSTGSVLQIANWYANFGERREAEEALQHAEDRRGRMGSAGRQKTEASYRMRVAQIRRTAEAARRAIKSAEGNPYMTNTAYVLAGNILVSENPIRARTFFESILAQERTSSWLYRAESLFGIASLMLRDREAPEVAYQLLATSQYIYVTLGLQGTPHPGFHDYLKAENLTPADVIRYDTQLATLNKSYRLGLRQEAIIESGVQAEIMSDVVLLVPSKQRGQINIIPSRKAPRVLVLGSDAPAKNMRVLRKIARYVAHAGYKPIIVKDELEFPEESIEEKVARLVASSRFVLIEHSRPSGHIDELRGIARERNTVAVLHEQGVQATWMQSDYDIDFPGVRYFPYQPQGLESAVGQACAWAEQRVMQKARALMLYPWRKTI